MTTRLPQPDGGFPPVELKSRRPEPPDAVEGRPVGVKKHRDAACLGQGDQVAVKAVRRRRRARAGERQGLDRPRAEGPLDRVIRAASASPGVIAGSGSKKAVCSAVSSVRTVRISRVGAAVRTTSGSRPSLLAQQETHSKRRRARRKR